MTADNATEKDLGTGGDRPDNHGRQAPEEEDVEGHTHARATPDEVSSEPERSTERGDGKEDLESRGRHHSNSEADPPSPPENRSWG
jgi:hypothetical protein